MADVYRICIIFFVLNNTYAQDNWNLTDTWNALLENNYQIKSQEILIRQSETDISSSRALFYPQLMATSNYRYQSELAELELPFPGADKINAGTNSQYDIAVSLNQQVFTGFRNTNQLKSANVQHELRTNANEILKQQLMFRSGLLYYDIQKNVLQQKALSASLRRAENQLVRVRNLLDAQQVTAFDTLETANRKFEIQNKIDALKDYHKILRAQLADIIHIDPIPELAPLDLHLINSSNRTLAEWQSLASKNRKEIDQINKSGKLQNHRTDIQRANYFPQIYASVSYHYARPGVNFFVDEWMNYYTVGFQLEWNLWNWKRDAMSVQKSVLEERRIDLSRNELEFNIQNEVRQAYLQVGTAQKQVQLQRQFVHLEEERYRITNERFEQGLTTILDVNSAEESLTTAQLQLQQNIINWFTAKLRLAYSAGDILSVN